MEHSAYYSPAGARPDQVLLQRTVGPSDIGEEIGKMAQEGVQESVSDEVFVSYKHTELIQGCRPHPGDIVEAGSLSAIDPPVPWYPLADSLPRTLVENGLLSSLQLAGILYASQRHQLLLPDSTRAGFFLGDAAGVGKGRQIAGIILDNCARKRGKHIWFSISTDLIVDARRDLEDIGCYIKVIEGCKQLDKETRVFGLPADFKEGVIFSTYATLVSSVQKGSVLSASKQSRLQQLMDWCGGSAFDGCLIFDECHKAKNFVPGNDQASTKVALAVASIQRLLPKARVVYCSATGVTDVKNMAFMERLGLWGDGATFKSFEQFIETVQRKGLGVAEMLAMEMKATGMYLSRGLSFKQTQFDKIEISLTEEQMKMYNTAAHLWHEVKKSLEHAVERCGGGGRVWSTYWSAHQRFFKQLCMGIKVPAVVELAKKSLDAGRCVVIGLQTTGEASMDVELCSGHKSGFMSLCREILRRFLENNFPTTVQGKVDGPPEDEWSETAKQMLLGFTNQISLPNSPLDELIDQLGGPGAVAEMTGRRGRIVRRSSSDKPQYEARGADISKDVDSLNVQERNEFMSGRKLVAVISDAASTGVSLHADQRVANDRRRVHITLELPWSADKAVQQMGRSHRSNQRSGPMYQLLTTNLGGERRFAAAVARRLQSLGALTKGDRRAASGADLDEFNFDTPYGRQALRNMYASICQRHLASGVSMHSVTHGKIDFADFNGCMLECLTTMGLLESSSLTTVQKVKDGVAGNVGMFLNRILGLKVEKQNLIFNYFTNCMESLIAMTKREGRYNEGLVDITGSSVEEIGAPREIFHKSKHNPTFHRVVQVDRGMSWESAIARLENHPGEENGFYCSRKDVRGKRFYVLAALKPQSTHLFSVARPGTGLSAFDEDRTDLNRKYTLISRDKAEAGWRENYKTSRSNCIHGPNCRNGPSCNVGSRCYQMHLLCGGIVTMMSHLENTLARYGPKLRLTKAESSLRVVRVQLNSGERMVGIRYPHMLIPIAERELLEQDKVTQFLLSQSQTGGAPASARAPIVISPQSPQRKLQTEAVSEVSAKCLAKATQPPVTIRNFFKPLAKHHGNGEADEAMRSEDAGKAGDKGRKRSTAMDRFCASAKKRNKVSANNRESHDNNEGSSESNGHVTNKDTSNVDENSSSDFETETTAVKPSRVHGKRSREEVVMVNSDTESPIKLSSVSKSDKPNPNHPNAKLTFSLDKENTGSFNSPTTSKHKQSSSNHIESNNNRATSGTAAINSAGSQQKKRPLLSSSSKIGANKKSRTSGGKTPKSQGKLMACFAKAKSIQEASKAVSCPICSVEFEAATSNADINKHVDNCLIE